LNRVFIRYLIRTDLKEVLSMEALSSALPWKKRDLLGALRQNDCVGMSAEVMGELTGFIVYRRGVESLSLLRMAVHPAWRRRGVGSRMLSHLIGKLNDKQTRLLVEVGDENLGAHLFLRAAGLRASFVRGFRGNDSYLFEYGECRGRNAHPFHPLQFP
jgi:ribosomal-protein-alanine N-acetyltransferase